MNWNTNHLEFLIKNYPKYSRIELCEAFNANFKTQVSVKQITSTLKRNHIKSQRDTKFTKGCRPWHAGTTGKKPRTRGTFKPGVTFSTHKKIGDEVMKNGFWYVKTDQGKMRPKHQVVFERHNGRTIKANHRVIFIDGDRENFNIENLTEVTYSQFAAIVRRGLIKKQDSLSNCEKLVAMIDFHPNVVG